MMPLPAAKSSRAAVAKLPRLAHWVRHATALIACAAVGLLFSAFARAEDDLPGRVGRVADLAGAVSLAPEERAGQWEPVGINQTIISGDNLFVSPEGRAEVDYGGGQFRLGGDTSVNVARLDDRTITLFVAQGRVILRVRVLDPGDAARIDTPNAQVQITRPGLYRVEVTEDRLRTLLVVREGEANIYLANMVQQVLPGQTADVTGDAPTQADVRSGSFSDGFDAWSASRDRHYEKSRSATYVSRQMVGYADLDDYGAWESYPEYGAVWFPTAVAADWAPYRFGSWSWVGGFGWTWVDDAPWGYAPFHYGRWAYVGGRWGWCPGGWVARPVWAPALVGWYGGPTWSFSLSLGGPAYGWVPLGWGEPYLPAWSNCSHRCWTMYNRPYAVRYNERPASPPSRYVNQGAPGGFTAVNRETFVGGQRVSRNVLAVPQNAVATAPVLGGAPVQVRPTPARIPGARPGAPGVPPPASTFYPTGRPSRLVGESAPGAPARGPSGFIPEAGQPAGTSSPGGRAARPVRPSGGEAVPAAPARVQAPEPATPAGSRGRAASTAPSTAGEPARAVSPTLPPTQAVRPPAQAPSSGTPIGTLPTRPQAMAPAPAQAVAPPRRPQAVAREPPVAPPHAVPSPHPAGVVPPAQVHTPPTPGGPPQAQPAPAGSATRGQAPASRHPLPAEVQPPAPSR